MTIFWLTSLIHLTFGGTGFPRYSRGLRSWEIRIREYQNHCFRLKLMKFPSLFAVFPCFMVHESSKLRIPSSLTWRNACILNTFLGLVGSTVNHLSTLLLKCKICRYYWIYCNKRVIFLIYKLIFICMLKRSHAWFVHLYIT